LILSPHDGAKTVAAVAETSMVSAPIGVHLLLYSASRRGGGGGATVRPFLTETTTMILFAILISIAAIGLFCWLLFTLATFALPLFMGVSVGVWAYNVGAGWLGAILIGLIGAAMTLGIGQILLIVVRPTWARLLIAMIFVAPAAIAGYHATHGIVKHAMPSESWQIAFSIIGAVAVGVTAFLRVAGMAAVPSGQGFARARHLYR
jgi:hypothetical protein